MPPFPTKLKKPHCAVILGALLPRKLQNNNFCQNMFYPISSLCAVVTLCKKYEKFKVSIFHKTQKTCFGPLFVQKSQSKDFY